jgi:Nucleotidyl transferase AbiEii toxin, Type IV TA system
MPVGDPKTFICSYVADCPGAYTGGRGIFQLHVLMARSPRAPPRAMIRVNMEQWTLLRGGGQRVSRHYYDVDRILRTEAGQRAATDRAMAEDCGRHERMSFKRAGQDTAKPGSFALVPPPAMLELLRADYQAMAVMIFGGVPAFDTVIASIVTLEATVNQ